jgi:hypothetical protein
VTSLSREVEGLLAEVIGMLEQVAESARRREGRPRR